MQNHCPKTGIEKLQIEREMIRIAMLRYFNVIESQRDLVLDWHEVIFW